MVLYFLILLSFLYAQVDYATEIQPVFTNDATDVSRNDGSSPGVVIR